MKRTYFILLIFTFSQYVNAQNKYWVFFRDKKNTSFNPYEYFHKDAIERRLLNNLSLYDSTDYPLNDEYKKSVLQLADSAGNDSRWFNAVAVYATDANIRRIRKLPYVKDVKRIGGGEILKQKKDTIIHSTLKNNYDTALMHYQVRRMKGNLFLQNGYTGKGIRIAVLDAGFSKADKHPAFEHIRSRNGIAAAWDFIKKNNNPYATGMHGTMVLSCIAGKYNNENIGLAQDADFLLARTEWEDQEKKYEEDCWVAALEWADKNGARLVNSSLGYGSDRYFIEDMDGKISLVSRGASLAAKKGMLIVNSAGNEGTGYWHYIITPSDNDSVLCVGGTNPYTDYHIDFSSYGPSATKKLKPNVSNCGRVFCASPDDYENSEGTSFSAPLTTGFIACAWSKNPQLTNMQIFRMTERSGHLYPYYDYAHGYGIPQAAWWMDSTYKQNTQPTFTIVDSIDEGSAKKDVGIQLADTFFVIENDIVNRVKPNVFMYYHYADEEGHIIQYQLLKPAADSRMITLQLPKELYGKNGMLRIHFMGYTRQYNLASIHYKKQTP